MHCYSTSDQVGLEFSAFLKSGGLVSPAEFASMIGGIFPIALWSFLHMLGAAPDIDVAFEDETDREAARNFMDLLAASQEAEED